MTDNIQNERFNSFGGFLKFFHILIHYFIIEYAYYFFKTINSISETGFMIEYLVVLLGYPAFVYCFYMISEAMYQKTKNSLEKIKKSIIITGIVVVFYNLIYSLTFNFEYVDVLRPIFYLSIIYVYFSISKRVRIYYC